jgi:hypothetical protein
MIPPIPQLRFEPVALSWEAEPFRQRFTGVVTEGGDGAEHPRPVRAIICATPRSAFPLATAVLAPVKPVVALDSKLISIDMPPALGTAFEDSSTPSVIPEGGVQLAHDVKLWPVTSIVLATVVETEGEACDNPLAVGTPPDIFIGDVVLTL